MIGESKQSADALNLYCCIATSFTFEMAGDTNGDGLDDVTVIYPEGECQIFQALAWNVPKGTHSLMV